MNSDANIWNRIVASDQQALKALFDRYFTPLVRFAATITNSPDVAEELVQDVFVYIWHKRASIRIRSDIKSYLFTAVRNASLNYLKSKAAKVAKSKVAEHVAFESASHDTEHVRVAEFKQAVANAINSLPHTSKSVFLLSRNLKLSNKEIAQTLNIHVKTVESHITLALRAIREYLQQYWYMGLVFFSKLF